MKTSQTIVPIFFSSTQHLPIMDSSSPSYLSDTEENGLEAGSLEVSDFVLPRYFNPPAHLSRSTRRLESKAHNQRNTMLHMASSSSSHFSDVADDSEYPKILRNTPVSSHNDSTPTERRKISDGANTSMRDSLQTFNFSEMMTQYLTSSGVANDFQSRFTAASKNQAPFGATNEKSKWTNSMEEEDDDSSTGEEMDEDEDEDQSEDIHADESTLDHAALRSMASFENYYQQPVEEKKLLGGTTPREIPGSPWATSGPVRQSTRPTRPLPQAKYVSLLTLLISFGLVLYLVLEAFWSFVSIGSVIAQIILAIFSFFGT